jgi:hypothetical protein
MFCRHFCRADGDCTSGGRCDVPVYNSMNMQIMVGGNPLTVCSAPVTSCNAIAQTGCPGAACFVVTPTGLTGCHAAGTATQDATCKSDFDCKAGFTCLNFGSGAHCLQYCDLTKPTCPSGHSCYYLSTCSMCPNPMKRWSDNPNLGFCDSP